MVTAQSAGAYKPRPEPYRRALDLLALPAERVLFVAGSPYDISGTGHVDIEGGLAGLDANGYRPLRLPIAGAEGSHIGSPLRRSTAPLS
jgi:hypothetical protein